MPSRYIAIALLACLMRPVCADTPIPSVFTVAYGPHPRQVMDIWPVETVAATPLVLYVHGGGFTAGDKAAVLRLSLIRPLHEAGIAIASMNYRFIEHAPLAEILRDGSKAVQYLRAHANNWHIDPTRIAMVGTSAGAGIALWTALRNDIADPDHADPVRRQSSRLRCAVAINPQAGFDPRTWIQVMGLPPEGVLPSFQKYWPGKPPTIESLLQATNAPALSVMAFITPDDPPLFLMNTYRDRAPRNTAEYQHHPDHVYAIATRCRAVGIPHVVSPRSDGNQQTSRMLDFLREHLFNTE